jgi:ribonucleoside-triphosphate reductase
MANNSTCYTEKPDAETFMREWLALVESKSGERGIFSRVASQRQAAKNGRRDSEVDFGTNPCSEIILRPYQFCNLTEVVVRSGDTIEDLERKVRLATILGTIQSTYTHFPYLRKKWKDNTEEERLLGVSLTGIMDNPITNGTGTHLSGSFDGKPNTLEQVLEHLRKVAIDTNTEWSHHLLYLFLRQLHASSRVGRYLNWWILLQVFTLVIVVITFVLSVEIIKTL